MSIPRNLSIIADTLNSDGTFASISNTGSTTLSSGTANGVAYLNGSKVLTTGSALTFDGTNVGIGGTPTWALDITTSAANIRVAPAVGTNNALTRYVNTGGTGYVGLDNSAGGLTTAYALNLYHTGAYPIVFSTSGTERMRIDSSGNVGIGTTSPSAKLQVVGTTKIGEGVAANTSKLMVNTVSGVAAGIQLFQDTVEAWIIQNPASSTALTFSNSGTERARIDGSGNVGIGTSSPAAKLNVNGTILVGVDGTSSSGDQIIRANNTSAGYTNDPGGNLVLKSGQGTGTQGSIISLYTSTVGASGSSLNALAERMRIDSSGNVGIGTSSPSSKLEIYNSGDSALTITGNTASGNYAGVDFKRTTGTVNASVRSQSVGGNDIGEMYFMTRPSAGSLTERMRIDSSGNLLVNSTAISNSPARGVQLWSGSSNSIGGVAIGHDTGVASGNYYAIFNYASGIIGSITQSGTTAVLFNVTSDQRLKENIQDAASASALIDSLQVRQFDWKTDNSHQRYGFIAQELVTVAPEAVHQPSDPDEMMAVDYSKLVPMLVKEIQSLRKRLTALEST